MRRSHQPLVPREAPAPCVVLGLGSNLGDRLAALRRAAEAIGQLSAVWLDGRSSVYQSPPAGGPSQPDYLNAAIAVRSRRPLGELLGCALAIERRMGRRRPDPVRWGPRPIDIDLLWTNRGPHREPGLTVPHPRLTERPFALQPLLELVPDAADAAGRRYLELPAAHAAIERVAAL